MQLFTFLNENRMETIGVFFLMYVAVQMNYYISDKKRTWFFYLKPTLDFILYMAIYKIIMTMVIP